MKLNNVVFWTTTMEEESLLSLQIGSTRLGWGGEIPSWLGRYLESLAWLYPCPQREVDYQWFQVIGRTKCFLVCSMESRRNRNAYSTDVLHAIQVVKFYWQGSSSRHCNLIEWWSLMDLLASCLSICWKWCAQKNFIKLNFSLYAFPSSSWLMTLVK